MVFSWTMVQQCQGFGEENVEFSKTENGCEVTITRERLKTITSLITSEGDVVSQHWSIVNQQGKVIDCNFSGGIFTECVTKLFGASKNKIYIESIIVKKGDVKSSLPATVLLLKD